jgi:hypothetical protein
MHVIFALACFAISIVRKQKRYPRQTLIDLCTDVISAVTELQVVLQLRRYDIRRHVYLKILNSIMCSLHTPTINYSTHFQQYQSVSL